MLQCAGFVQARGWSPPRYIYELINRCPEDPPAEKLPRQLHPEGRADGKLEQALILGQGKNILFPLLSKNMLKPFLSLDAIKTSCGSGRPRSLCPGRRQIKTAVRQSQACGQARGAASSHLRPGAVPHGPGQSLLVYPGAGSGHQESHRTCSFNSWY